MLYKSLRVFTLVVSAYFATTAFAARGRLMSNSIRELATDASVMAVQPVAAADAAQPVVFSIALTMPNLDELKARTAAGENLANGKLTAAQMESRYLPSLADYQAVEAWLKGQGFTIVVEDANHTLVTAQGTAAQVASAMAVDFAKVTTADGVFVSATNAPTLPADLPASILAVDGLQPHLRYHHHDRQLRNQAIVTGGKQYVTPADIRAAYGATAAMTGAGQTICLINDAPVLMSDITTFWTTVGVAQTASNFTTVPVNGGSTASGTSDAAEEGVLDVSYASSVAPGAKVRLYTIRSLLFSLVNTAMVQIMNDEKSDATITVLSMSFGGLEPTNGQLTGSLVTTNQELAQMAASGITVLASSGDAGSRPDPNNVTFGYEVNDPLALDYPASDPSVTGVGGTTPYFNSSFAMTAETVWSEIPASPVVDGAYGASGGGVSIVFGQPTWQTSYGGTVMTAHPNARLVPDVAAISLAVNAGNNYTPVVIIYGGSPTGVTGTSLATPVWGAVTAIVNQSRAAVSQSPIGFMNPALYQYGHTSAFNDITVGSNGTNNTYTAGAGYDLTTGLGSPNLPALVSILAGSAPTVSTQPANTSVQEGTNASFSAIVVGTPTPSFQWQRQASGTTTWVNTTDSSTSSYSGSTTTNLTVQLTTLAMSGDQFRIVATNAIGTATSNAATLTVTAKPVVVAAASSGGGGGGGAVSLWFYLAATALVGVRLIQAQPKRRLANVR